MRPASTWLPLIKAVSASENRVRALQRILAQRCDVRPAKAPEASPEPKTPTPRRKREWVKNEKRNRIIHNLLTDGEGGQRICETLDQRTIEVLPIMKRCKVYSWVEAWKNRELRSKIQQLLSKQRRSLKLVKP